MPLTKHHYVNVRNGRFDSTSAADLEALFQAVRTSGKDNLVVHFHGGLVSERSGMSTAARLLPAYESAGTYPVFFVWESHLDAVLLGNLREIFEERIFQRLLLRVTQFAQAKLKPGARTRGTRLELTDSAEIQDAIREPTGEVPFEDVDTSQLPPDATLSNEQEDQFREVLEMDVILQREAEAIANALRPPAEVEAERARTRGAVVRESRHTLMSPEVLEEIRGAAPSPSERGVVATSKILLRAAGVLKNVIQRFATRRDHGFYVTIVEEILRGFYLANAGRWVWSMMKQDTADAFGEDAQVFGGTAFLRELRRLWDEKPQLKVTLVGHSTGAIYIAHMLAAAEQHLTEEQRFSILFLAPAIDFKLLSRTLAAHEGRVADSEVNGRKVKHIRTFGMTDAAERADKLIPVVYPASLLYFVSGVCEEDVDMPLVGMQRYYSGGAPYSPQAYPEIGHASKFFTDHDCFVWSPTEVVASGRNCASGKHGDFDNDAATLESLSHVLQRGF